MGPRGEIFIPAPASAQFRGPHALPPRGKISPLPRSMRGGPPRIPDPTRKVDTLNSAYVGVDSCQIMMMDQQSEVNVLAIKKVGLYGPH